MLTKDLILVSMMILMTMASCSAMPVKHPVTAPAVKAKPKGRMIPVGEAYSLAEKAFVDSCLITVASLTRMVAIPDQVISHCEQMFMRYQMGEIGINRPKAKKIEPKTI